jgi:hypothetical protein
VKASYSTTSRSPTKIPEYLASGLPVIANTGVGDVDRLLVEDRVGILVSYLNDAGFEDVVDEIGGMAADVETSQRCRSSASNRFDLATVGGVSYRAIYDRTSEPIDD